MSIPVTAVSLAPSGHGVGETENVTYYVEDLLPGESAVCKVEHRSPHAPKAWAKILNRSSPLSSDRVTPHCPQSAQCGGCSWQHYRYENQLQLKQMQVENALGTTVSSIVGSDQYRYRNTAKYVPAKKNNVVRLGAFGRRSHDWVDTQECKVVEEGISLVASHLAHCLTQLDFPLYDEKSKSGLLRYVVVRAAQEKHQVLLIGGGTPNAYGVLAKDIMASPNATVSSILFGHNQSTGNVILPKTFHLLQGAKTLDFLISEHHSVSVPPGAFWQVNTKQARVLHEKIAQWCGNTHTVLDLFCGAGAISLPIAAMGAAVVGVDVVPQGIQAAQALAAQHHWDAHFLVADLFTDWTPPQADTWICNPPRKGIGDRVIDLIRTHRPKQFIYISCNPVTLVSDLKKLTQYVLDEAIPFDLMPGTPHVEVATRLRLKNSH